ncbi:hypothetical protein [Bradyrhizobium diazoefficiens]|nr:hypothetical protein [Bradyrhizobium diazoefficiens]
MRPSGQLISGAAIIAVWSYGAGYAVAIIAMPMAIIIMLLLPFPR